MARAEISAEKKIPGTLPKTQSFFYMPLLTHAYLNVKKISLPDKVTEKINLIKTLRLFTDERYNSMLDGIIYKLRKHPDLVILMEKSYKNIEGKGDKHSREPIDDVGHLRGDIQEKILNESYISTEKKVLFTSDSFPDTRVIKELLDFIIIMQYIPSDNKYFLKYLKYKNKYLNLKNLHKI